MPLSWVHSFLHQSDVSFETPPLSRSGIEVTRFLQGIAEFDVPFFLPQLLRRTLRINPLVLPKGPFIAPVVELAVMQGTEGHDPLVAGLEPPGAGLGEGEMMGLGRLPPADQAGLTGHILEMLAVADALRRPDRQDRLVDAAVSGLSVDGGR